MKIISQLVIISIIGAAGYWGWENRESLPFFSQEAEQSQTQKRPARSVPVIATKARLIDLKQTVTAVGTLQANKSIDVTAKVTAKIKELSFEDGQQVKQGAALVRLDDTEARAELAESQAELDNSRKLYERALKLLKSGNTPKARVDLLLSEMQVAEAKVQADRARLDDYIIRAPFAGVVGFRDVSVGALVRPTDVITTLDDITTLKLDFDLPEKNLAEVTVGQMFQASSVAFKDAIFQGTVSSISTRVDPVTRVVRVRGLIENDKRLLKPGMFLSVSLQTGMQRNAVMIPEHAITVSAAGHFAFTVENDLAVRKPVTVGQRQKGGCKSSVGSSQMQSSLSKGCRKSGTVGQLK
ncbi:efflux RND transporter periplasmic adaptor subunit [Sneathiella glossodoripedis]|uniref:efflux RND transporter periplasmic adaptor subunit n=1 Tax=Sneathiella glossodoripedis TaxID=418853 RepID=UPI000470FF44|nr:efflux RND transporter periplasmic adaptor subunit [Sneathiella glossodoripedis]